MSLNRFFNLLIIILFCSSCVSDPDAPQYPNGAHSGNFALALSEGNWGFNNSSISLVDLETGGSTQFYYRATNPGLILGDNANGMVNLGDTVFANVPGSSSIECFLASSGKHIARMLFESGMQPRRIVILNDTTGYVTELTENFVYGFNPKKIELNGIKIPVGPQPEGIAHLGNYIFTANSAYGDLNAKDPNAKTISVIDINRNAEIKKIPAGPNVVELAANTSTNKLYALYYNLPSEHDSLGGIIEYDGSSFAKLREWRVDARAMQIDEEKNVLYYLNYCSKTNGENSSRGMSKIELSQNDATPELILRNNSDHIWYWLSIDKSTGSFWISDAVHFNSDGYLIFYNSDLSESGKRAFKTGVNPKTILFFRNN